MKQTILFLILLSSTCFADIDQWNCYRYRTIEGKKYDFSQAIEWYKMKCAVPHLQHPNKMGITSSDNVTLYDKCIKDWNAEKLKIEEDKKRASSLDSKFGWLIASGIVESVIPRGTIVSGNVLIKNYPNASNLRPGDSLTLLALKVKDEKIGDKTFTCYDFGTISY